jgi:hypothetical protein
VKGPIVGGHRMKRRSRKLDIDKREGLIVTGADHTAVDLARTFLGEKRNSSAQQY